MGKSAVVAGTGFKNRDGTDRAAIIRDHVRDGMSVRLVREPDNEHDINAIAVYIEAGGIFGFGKRERQIGYIKASRSNTLAAKLDAGEDVSGKVKSHFAPEKKNHPRVSLELDY